MFKEKAPECGKISARTTNGSNHPIWLKWAYRITDNPFKRGSKEHVRWHNEFYDECKEIKRLI